MQKIYFFGLICLSLIFFTACKKNSGNGNSPYYIKATIGGTEKKYIFDAYVEVNIAASSIGTTYSYLMYAGAGGSSLEGLGFQINDTTPLITRTYDQTLGAGDYIITSNYNPGTSNLSEIFGAGLKLTTSRPLQIVITNISNTQIAGTISGEFYSNAGAGTDSLLITNGSFNLPM